MITKRHIEITLSFSSISIDLLPMGEDLLIAVQGGEKPHIGTAILSVPRPSLTGDGSPSCTSSILNVTGHRDDEICRIIAEKACRKYQCTCVCTGGFHMDGMSKEQILEVVNTIRNTDF